MYVCQWNLETPFGKRFAEGATACRRALEESG